MNEALRIIKEVAGSKSRITKIFQKKDYIRIYFDGGLQMLVIQNNKPRLYEWFLGQFVDISHLEAKILNLSFAN